MRVLTRQAGLVLATTQSPSVTATVTVLSGKVGEEGSLVPGGVVRHGGLAVHAMAGVPVTARQVTKRSALVWRWDAAARRWRPGQTWEVIGPQAARKRRACPGELHLHWLPRPSGA